MILNRHLRALLKRLGLDENVPPPSSQWVALLSHLNDHFRVYEDEKHRLNRSLDIHGREVQSLYKELVQERERLSSAIACLTIGFIIFDRNGQVSLMNAEAEQYLGWSESEGAQRNLLQLIGIEEGAHVGPLAHIMQSGQSINQSIPLRTKNGQHFETRVQLQPVLREGNLMGSVLTFETPESRRSPEENNLEEVLQNFLGKANLWLEHETSAEIQFRLQVVVNRTEDALQALTGEAAPQTEQTLEERSLETVPAAPRPALTPPPPAAPQAPTFHSPNPPSSRDQEAPPTPTPPSPAPPAPRLDERPQHTPPPPVAPPRPVERLQPPAVLLPPPVAPLAPPPVIQPPPPAAPPPPIAHAPLTEGAVSPPQAPEIKTAVAHHLPARGVDGMVPTPPVGGQPPGEMVEPQPPQGSPAEAHPAPPEKTPPPVPPLRGTEGGVAQVPPLRATEGGVAQVPPLRATEGGVLPAPPSSGKDGGVAVSPPPEEPRPGSPAAPAPAATVATPPAPTRPPDSNSLRVLLVEDEPVSQLVTQSHLERLGHECVTAGDANEAIRLYQRQQFDAVISSYLMPGMNGIDLCRKIREDSRGGYSYYILLTAVERKEEAARALEAGVDAFLTKPLDPNELAVRLKVAKGVQSRLNRVYSEVHHPVE